MRDEISETHRKSVSWADEVTGFHHRGIWSVQGDQPNLLLQAHLLTSLHNTELSPPFHFRNVPMPRLGVLA